MGNLLTKLKSYYKHLIIFILLLVLFITLFIVGTPKQYSENTNASISMLNVTKKVNYSGFTISNNKLDLSKKIGNILISNDGRDISSVKISFSSLSKKRKCVVSYKFKNAPDASQVITIEKNIHSKTLAFNIPSKNVTSINIAFYKGTKVSSIYASSSSFPYIIKDVAKINYNIVILYSTILSLMFTFLILRFMGILKRMFSEINKIPFFSIMKYVGLYLTVFLAICLIEKVFYNNTAFTIHPLLKYMNKPLLIFNMMLSVSIGYFLLFRKSFLKKLEYTFIMIALPAGIVLANCTPICSLLGSWDQTIHYNNANSVVNLAYKSYDSFEDNIGWLSKNHLWHSFSTSYNDLLIDRYNYRYKTSGLKETNVSYTPTQIYTNIGYIPYSIGIFLGRSMQLSLSGILVLGRVCGTMFYSLIMFFALRKLKFGKITLFTIALFPTFVFLSSAYSYDPWLIEFIIVSMTYLCNIIFSDDAKASNKDLIIILGSLFIALGPKAIYFPLYLLCFAIPQNRFLSSGQRNIYYSFIILCGTVTVFSFAFPLLISASSGKLIGDTRGDSNINGKSQIFYILMHPITYSKILLDYFRYFLSPNSLAYITGDFADLGTKAHYDYSAFIIAGSLFIGSKNNIVFQQKKKYVFVLAVLALGVTVIFIPTVFYIVFTGVGADYIKGCQVRYLLPLAFPFWLLISGLCKKDNFKHFDLTKILIGLSLLYLYGTIYLNLIQSYTI